MFDKNKVSRELRRIAKELVSASGAEYSEDGKKWEPYDSKVASKEGYYRNFTGLIKYDGSKGKVEDADFHLDDWIFMDKGTWFKGVWLDGNFSGNAVWKNGTWEGGYFDGNAVWKNGTWKWGTFFGNAVWENGTWEDGWFIENATWKRGTWKGGKDEYKAFHEEGDSPDKW